MSSTRRVKRASKKSFNSPSRPPIQEFNSWVLKYLSSLDTPVALSIWLLFEAGEFEQLVNKEIDPLVYNDPYRFRDDFAAVSFLRKSEFLKTNIDRREVALRSFYASEQQCYETNKRFWNLATDPLFKGPVVSLYNTMIRKISKILGDPKESQDSWDGFVEEFFDQGAFGPGSSTGVTGKDTSSVRKFREERQITSPLYRLIGPFLSTAYPTWFKYGSLSKVEFRETSKVITVPKNAKTNRTIAVEPGLNIWFQKAIGKMIRARLRRHGVELNDSSRNSKLSRLGSEDATLATVDFSAASDTVSKSLVRQVIPAYWIDLLEATRTASYALNGKVGTFEKFSSMGNGFTFELESLIFYSAALSCTEYMNLDCSKVSVYGDDIIIPSGAYDLYVEFTKFLGFTINKKKSFSSGYFRESCGAYWFDGIDVQPLFLKKDLSHAQRVINFANALRDLAHRRNCFIGCDARFEDVHSSVVASIPKKFRLFGERSAGQGAIHSNFDECCPVKADDGLEGYLFKSFIFPAVTLETDSPAILLARLGRLPTSEEETRCYGNEYSLRSVTKIQKSWIFVRQWYNFGPWF